MLNFTLALILIIAIWVLVVIAILIWWLVARSRKRQAVEEAASAGPRRRHPGAQATGPIPIGTHGELRVNPVPLGRAGSDSLAPSATADATLNATASSNAAEGPDLTQPVSRLPQAPANHAPGPEMFGLTTQREYERLASEPFQAPPADAFGRGRQTQPFSWAEASKSGPTVPTPRASEERVPEPSPAEARPVPEAPSRAAEPPSDDPDRTIIVQRSTGASMDSGWELVLPDGEAFELKRDVIVGRRPVPTDESAVVVISDPTRTLSKSHARLRFDGDTWSVTDLASTNGVWLITEIGVEQELEPNIEVEATSALRLGTLEVILRRSTDSA